MRFGANWKANPIGDSHGSSLEKSIQLLDNYARQGLANLTDREIIVYVPHVLVPDLSRHIQDKGYGFKLGAQNVSSYYGGGAYTGQVPVEMFVDFGVRDFLVGHSEIRYGYDRRSLETVEAMLASLRERKIGVSEDHKNKLVLRILAESNEIYNNKILTVLKEKDTGVTYCIGEALEEKERGVTFEVLENQLRGGLKGVNKEDYERIIISYEPRWAIGTDRTPAEEEIHAAHSKIREMVGESVTILYGGSVSPENITQIIGLDNVNGVLVGGASLDAESFASIVLFDKE